MARVPADERDPQLTAGVRAIAILARQFGIACQRAGLSLPQYRLLFYMQMKPQRASQLAEAAAVKRPTLTALVDGLVDAGLMTRRSVESDRRGIRLELTEDGRKKLAEVEELLRECLARFARMGDEPLVLSGLSSLAYGMQREAERHLVEQPDPGR